MISKTTGYKYNYTPKRFFPNIDMSKKLGASQRIEQPKSI